MPPTHDTTPPQWMNEINGFLPPAYQEHALTMKAFVRTRKVQRVEDLLRALFCWAFAGLTLRQLGIWGTVQHLGALSDRAWSQRLTRSHAWVLWLLSHLLLTTAPPAIASPRRIRVVDASTIRTRHQTGHRLRLHTSYLLQEQRIDEILVTTDKQGESVTHLTWRAGDLVMADRGYCRRPQIAHLMDAHADFVIRWHSTNVPFFTRQGSPFDVAVWLMDLSASQAEYAVSDGAHPLRLIACRLSARAAKRARKKCRRSAQKNGQQVQARTLFLAGWLLLVTSLPPEEASVSQVLDLYRARWQVELLFKRIKQLLDVHRLPSFHDQTNQIRLGILLCGWLLIEASHQRLLAAAPPSDVSIWQCQSLLVRAFQHQLLGPWSLALVSASWPALQRYLRPSRPLGKRWSLTTLLSSLASLFVSA